jgi:hypothetical protein
MNLAFLDAHCVTSTPLEWLILQSARCAVQGSILGGLIPASGAATCIVAAKLLNVLAAVEGAAF